MYVGSYLLHCNNAILQQKSQIKSSIALIAVRLWSFIYIVANHAAINLHSMYISNQYNYIAELYMHL